MVNQISYQGLFYLSAAFSTFITLFLTLRSLSLKKECQQVGTHDFTHCWHTKEQLKIVEIIEETHDIKSFRFRRLNDLKLDRYMPGQFLSFQIGDDPKILRSYSLSSTCENESILQVSIKHLTDGVGSGWFHSLNKGDKVWAFPPHGLFTDDNLKNEDRIYIAGGIGITPVLSMILTGLDRSTDANRYLFYAMKSTADMAFHTMLAALSNRFDHFNYFPIVSGGETWDGDTGHLTLDYIKSKINIKSSAHFYFCGPPIMTDGIMGKLVASKHSKEYLHGEKFASPVAFDPENIPHRSATIGIGNKDYKYNGKESILEFLEQNDIDMPFACRVGVCGSCKCKLVAGEVDEVTDSGLTKKDKNRGYILSCVARPTSDVKIEII